MPRLRIALLGNFAVTLNDAPVNGFAYDKVRALLAYLAVECDRPHHRDHMADLLWPGYPERSARQNLSQALSTLRGALGDRDADPPFLLVDSRELQFNRASNAWLDVAALTDHLHAAQAHTHVSLAECAVCRGHLEQGAALYRGDFLADLLLADSAPFEEWALLQREALRRQILDGLERLAESYLQRGEADAALHHARRQLALDAWCEPAHRQVMRALVLGGQRNAAIAHYEECRRLLAAGLGVEPETATLELAAALKSNTLSGSTQVFTDDGRPEHALIGKAIGSYLIVAYLGQGGMGQVYKAYHTRLARYVALKFIRPEFLQADALRAFEQEAKTLARLNHPNIVQVYDFGELAPSSSRNEMRDEAQGMANARQPYLVMEYVAGQTLEDWLPSGSPLPLEQAWPILQQISAALDHAHEQGIIHRDIKPGNVMLTPDGHALLGDFGISKLLRPGEDAAYTASTTGTPAYMAPEQVDLNLGPISPATDVYALGVVAYEMLTGYRPFQGVTPISEMLQRIQAPPTPPRHYNPTLPEAVERVLLTALSKDPQARYPRAGAFMRALAAAAPECVTLIGEQSATHVPAWWPQFAAESAPAPGDPPFMGLRSFDVADADLFFGREALTTRLLRQLFLAQPPGERPAPEHGGDVEVKRGDQNRFLAIVGASGSGKSSLVRAGLVAAMRRGEILAGSAHWPVYVLTPTAHPLESLALTLTQGNESVTAAATLMDDMVRDPRSLRLYLRSRMQESRNKKQESRIENPVSNNQPLLHTPYSLLPTLLVIDQFEEVFTLCRDADERRAFIANLLTAAQRNGAPFRNGDAGVFVVLTLRADFYDHCAQYPDLREAVSQRQVYIGPMTVDGLRHAIEEPAKRGGWDFEPGLVDLLLQDVGAGDGRQPEPGALPLLSHALLETWKRRRGHTMTLGGYAEAGGVRGAIARTAEAVYQQLDAGQQAIARNIFLRLTELGEGTQDTRRRVRHAEIRSQHADAAEVDEVLAALADARLITTEQETVQVAHEALIREWPTLRRWLEEDREGLRVHRHLTEAAQAWETLGRDPGELYRGARLAQAAEWAAAHAAALNTLEREFLAAAQADAEREEAEREARRQRELEAAQRLVEAEKRRAEEKEAAARQLRRQACVNLANSLAARSAVEQVERPDLALLLALEAQTLVDGPQTRGTVLTALQNNPGRVRFLEGTHRDIRAIAVSPDGKMLAAGNQWDLVANAKDNTVHLWDMASDQWVERSFAADMTPLHLAFSPDGKTLAVGGGKVIEEGWGYQEAIVFWDIATGQLVHSIWGAPIQPPPRWPPFNQSLVNSIAYSPDGTLLAAGYNDGAVVLWDAAQGTPVVRILTERSAVVQDLAFTPDGMTLAAAVGCKTDERLGECPEMAILFWDLSAVGALLASEQALRETVRPEQLAETIRLTRAITPANYVKYVRAIAVSPDGRLLAVLGCEPDPGGACSKTRVALWNLETGEVIGRFSDYDAAQFGAGLAFSPEGQFLAAGMRSKLYVWDAKTMELVGRSLVGPSNNNDVSDIAFTPDGHTLIAAYRDGVIGLWESPAYGNTVGTLFARSPAGFVFAALSPDGKTLACGDMDGFIHVWDTATGQPTLPPLAGHEGPVMSVAFSPDGKTLASGGYDHTLRFWDIASGALVGGPIVAQTTHLNLGTLQGYDGVFSVVYSPDGQTLATGDFGGGLYLWDIDRVMAGQPVSHTLGHMGPVFRVAFSPDGQKLASVSWYGMMRLWDVATLQPVSLPLQLHPVAAVAFSPDGKMLVADSDLTGIRLLDMSQTASFGQPIGVPMVHSAALLWVTFSPDGKTLAASDIGGDIRLWDVATQQLIGQPIKGHTNIVTSVLFSPDGKTLYSSSLDGTIRTWDVNPDSWRARACELTRRNLTQAEWAQYLPGEPYRQTCPQWPAGE